MIQVFLETLQGLRDSIASIRSQSKLAQNLIANQISGPAYLEEIADEMDEPLLWCRQSNSNASLQ